MHSPGEEEAVCTEHAVFDPHQEDITPTDTYQLAPRWFLTV